MDTPEGDPLDRADMASLVAGDEAALGNLMRRHGEPLFHFLCRITGSPDEANDLAQEAFVRVYRASASYRPEYKFKTWLYTIAGNLARNHLRWRTRHHAVSLDADANDSETSLADTLPSAARDPRQSAEADERAQTVRTAVARLPEDLREAIVLCEWEEMSMAEAAVVMKTTAKAVESKLYRARKLLRERLFSSAR
jgi:RNA polymerase sigma-70 factor, ECF subfamily